MCLRPVTIRQIGINTLRKRFKRKLIKVVIGILWIEVDAFFDTENANGENAGGMMFANARKAGFQHPASDHAAFGGSITAIIKG